jgi:hypothetical protein
MKHEVFHPRKNDFFFAFLMAAVFAVTIVGEVAGVLSVGREQVAVESAKAKAGQARVALAGASERAPPVALSGARK